MLLGFYDGIGRAGVGYHAPPLSSAFECPADLDRWRGHAYIVTNRGAAQLIAEALPLDVQAHFVFNMCSHVCTKAWALAGK